MLILIVLGLVLLTGIVVFPFLWWSIRTRRDLILAPVEVVADSAGLAMTSAQSSGRHDWSVFRRARETDQAIILETGTHLVFMLPKRGATDADLQAFRRLLVEVGLLRDDDRGWASATVKGVAIGLLAAVIAIAVPFLLSRS